MFQVMVSLDTESVQNALTASMPALIPGLGHNFTQPQPPTTDDEQLSEANLLNNLAQQVSHLNKNKILFQLH